MQQTTTNANGPPGQPSWIPHNTQQGQPFDPSTPRPQMAVQNQQQPLGQPSPSLQQAQAQANHLVSQGLVPPRSSQTPQLHSGQQPGSQHASPFNNLQAGGGPPFPFSANTPQPGATGLSQNQPGPSTPQGAGAGNSGGNMPLPDPLSKGEFELTYRSFCAKVKMEPRAASIDNRPVDLHQLHFEVMKEGGQTNVSCCHFVESNSSRSLTFFPAGLSKGLVARHRRPPRLCSVPCNRWRARSIRAWDRPSASSALPSQAAGFR